MNKLREAAEMALEAMKEYDNTGELPAFVVRNTIKTLRQALNADAIDTSSTCVDENVKREHEPVAWMHVQGDYKESNMYKLHEDDLKRGWEQYPLYAAPPSKEWVGLTDEERIKLINGIRIYCGDYEVLITRTIEAALKEKNNG